MLMSDLKNLMVQLAALGVPDSAQVRVQRPDLTRIDIYPTNFIVEGKDATYSIDASGHWAAAVSEADAVVLKQV